MENKDPKSSMYRYGEYYQKILEVDEYFDENGVAFEDTAHTKISNAAMKMAKIGRFVEKRTGTNFGNIEKIDPTKH